MPERSPAIVLVTHTRPRSLRRALASLQRADYGEFTQIPLCISVDHSQRMSEIRTVVEGFSWRHGEKIALFSDKRLGLREHMLRCGDLTEKFGSIILLEDDLYLSPCFYRYAAKALNFYANDDRIAGVALYAQAVNESCRGPFIPLDDGADIYFSQSPCSWGVAFTESQWAGFRSWFRANPRHPDAESLLPPDAAEWPATSWKKRLFAYTLATERFLVYPRRSLSTNFGDPGAHFSFKTREFQTPILLKWSEPEFRGLDESLIVYDGHWELKPDRFRALCEALEGYDLTVDVNGVKDLEKARSEYALTTKRPSRFVQSFGLEMTPPELNVIAGVSGSDIFLCRIEDALGRESGPAAGVDWLLHAYPYLPPQVSGLLRELAHIRSSPIHRMAAPFKKLGKYLRRLLS